MLLFHFYTMNVYTDVVCICECVVCVLVLICKLCKFCMHLFNLVPFSVPQFIHVNFQLNAIGLYVIIPSSIKILAGIPLFMLSLHNSFMLYSLSFSSLYHSCIRPECICLTVLSSMTFFFVYFRCMAVDSFQLFIDKSWEIANVCRIYILSVPYFFTFINHHYQFVFFCFRNVLVLFLFILFYFLFFCNILCRSLF